ncbi:hypothetical protein LENED_002357 [Lentinula edodes]|uniref:Uncharacterized protein n=1 Tax=Lentinula edodes TaxID=5353 RepID=A0A1Q3E0Q0_LENED|nr:hypothetical protein LENED_002357 [Lentinula edodes]
MAYDKLKFSAIFLSLKNLCANTSIRNQDRKATDAMNLIGYNEKTRQWEIWDKRLDKAPVLELDIEQWPLTPALSGNFRSRPCLQAIIISPPSITYSFSRHIPPRDFIRAQFSLVTLRIF